MKYIKKYIKKYKKKLKNLKKKSYKKYSRIIKNIIKYYTEINKIKINIKEIKKINKKEKEKEIKEYIKNEIKKENKILKILKKKVKKNKNKIKKKEIIVMEIKPGTGGEEASLFINDLLKMYINYIKKKKWKNKIISAEINNTKYGGYKEITIIIKGKEVYNKLKYESGVHRVQRNPKTSIKDKVQTSTCKVAVYKQKKKNNNNIIDEKDIKIETFKSSGAGGQHINKTNSAIRIRHIPTKIVVECQKERSQHKNKKEALKILKTKIMIMEENKKIENIRKLKKNLFGAGKRSEKIRTYNYKENRITDHRFKINLNKLNLILEGNIDILYKKFKKQNNKNLKNKNTK